MARKRKPRKGIPVWPKKNMARKRGNPRKGYLYGRKNMAGKEEIMKIIKQIFNKIFVEGLAGMGLGLFATLIIEQLLNRLAI